MKLVILDRDGTINVDSDEYIKTPEEWKPLPGALEAISRLNHAGWHTVIATNQSGLARGMFDTGTLNAVHVKMNQALARIGGRIDAVFFCPHGPNDGCDCRKPLPGLFHLIGERFGIDLAEVPLVGDSLRDLQAGFAAGCPTHLVRTGKCAARAAALPPPAPNALPTSPPAVMHADLAAFAEHLIQGERAVRGAAGMDDSGFGRLE